MAIQNKYEDAYVKLEIKDGLLFCTYQSNLEITLDVAKNMIASRFALVQNKAYPTLIDGRQLKSIDWPARHFFASEEGRKGIKAAALLTGSKFTRYIGNFFLKITDSSPAFPARLFTNKEKALQWLEQYK